MRGNTIWKRLSIATIVSISMVAPPGTAQKPSVSKLGMDAQKLARIPVRLKLYVDQGTIPGAVTLVARRGKVVSLEAVGYQDLETKKPMRADTIFDIRSVTKAITAIGIMILMEEGKLALNDPVEKYLPELRAAPQAEARLLRSRFITCLTHTAGLPLYRLPESQEIPIKRDRTLADYVSFLSKQEPEYEPGTQFRYSSGGFAILGRIIEVVSGQPYEAIHEGTNLCSPRYEGQFLSLSRRKK